MRLTVITVSTAERPLQHACILGCEGTVSKRLSSPYHAGRTDQWLKMKNPKAPAVRREREIDWAKR